jgi:hypothetical protein
LVAVVALQPKQQTYRTSALQVEMCYPRTSFGTK